VTAEPAVPRSASVEPGLTTLWANTSAAVATDAVAAPPRTYLRPRPPLRVYGPRRDRVVERGPDGRLGKGPRMRSLQDAERPAGMTGIEKEQEEVGLVQRGYPINGS